MRIAIQTLGTRGDVQPYVALALDLMREGSIVQLAAPAQYRAIPSSTEFLARRFRASFWL